MTRPTLMALMFGLSAFAPIVLAQGNGASWGGANQVQCDEMWKQAASLTTSQWAWMNKNCYWQGNASQKPTTTGSSNAGQREQLVERDQAWQRDHDAKVRGAQERLNSITSGLNQRTNAFTNATNQIVEVIQQNQRERDARRELERLEEEVQEHQAEMERLLQEVPSSQPIINNVPAPTVDPYALQRAQEEAARRLQQQQEKEARSIQSDACKTLIEAAALAGGSVDLGGDNACSRDINTDLGPNSTYVTTGGSSPFAKPRYNPAIDGSDVPSSIDFRNPGSSALDQLTSSTIPPANGPGTDGTQSGVDANPSGDALYRLIQTIPITDNSSTNPPTPEEASSTSRPSNQPALSRLTNQIISTIKEKGPEFAYDKAGEKLAEKVYEDPATKGIGKLLEDALTGPSAGSEEKPGFFKQKGIDFLADTIFDKMDELRHRITTDQAKVDETPNGEQLRDLLWSMDPTNLRKGIYSYPKEMLDKLNGLLDAALGREKQEK